MAKYKVVMLADSSLTLDKIMADDAQSALARLKDYDAEVVYVQDQKGWPRAQFVEYASKVEHEGPEVFEANPELLEQVADADVLLANFAPVNKAVIDAGKKLKMIGVTRSGAENVNIEAATAAGIKVCVSPGRLVEPVSDFTVGLLLAESRNIARMSVTDHNGQWFNDAPNSSYIRALKGQVVGIIGYGIIGQRVGQKLAAFGCQIIAYDPFTPDSVFEKNGVRRVSLEELMSTADVVTVHARLTKDTQGLVTKELIGMMKPHAYFINTARAGLVDYDALTDALVNHKIGGAGLDVFTEEPIPADSPLLTCDNVTLTPHRAGNCSNIAFLSLDIIVSDVERLLKGEPLAHPKN